MFEKANQVLSFLRILHHRMKYPALRIDFSSHLSAGVELIACDGSNFEIKNTFMARGVFLKAEAGATLKIKESYIGMNSMIVAHDHIEIMPNCSIGEMVVIRDQNHQYGKNILIRDSGYETAKIVIQKNVWVGSKATILKGVELGENTVVGAHAIVNESFPANSVLVGSPARAIVDK